MIQNGLLYVHKLYIILTYKQNSKMKNYPNDNALYVYSILDSKILFQKIMPWILVAPHIPKSISTCFILIWAK